MNLWIDRCRGLINGQHFMGALSYSLQGLRFALSQQAIKHELIALLLLCSTLAILQAPMFDFCVVVAGWLFVIALELLNTGLEVAFDMLTLDFDVRVKNGKDVASAAVFVAMCANILLWLALLSAHMQ